MSVQTVTEKYSPDQVVEALLRRTSKADLRRLVEAAAEASGSVISASSGEPGDEFCPVIHLPFPPHGSSLDGFLKYLFSARRPFEVFPIGVVQLEAIQIKVNLGARADIVGGIQQ